MPQHKNTKMQYSNIVVRVQSAAADVFGLSVAAISETASPKTIDSWDSVQHLNLILVLEEQFGVQFKPEEIDKMNSIESISRIILTHIG